MPALTQILVVCGFILMAALFFRHGIVRRTPWDS